jgi:hypothetical protein
MGQNNRQESFTELGMSFPYGLYLFSTLNEKRKQAGLTLLSILLATMTESTESIMPYEHRALPAACFRHCVKGTT